MAVTTSNKDIMDTSWYFSTPVYRIEKPEFLSSAIKATDKYIKESEKREQSKLKERKKWLGNKDYLKVKENKLYLRSIVLKKTS